MSNSTETVMQFTDYVNKRFQAHMFLYYAYEWKMTLNDNPRDRKHIEEKC